MYDMIFVIFYFSFMAHVKAHVVPNCFTNHRLDIMDTKLDKRARTVRKTDRAVQIAWGASPLVSAIF